ncbi:MAG TPA: PD-(D/E)XK nuclease family protein [bacterium]|nr:PD-(D/E)XK nuclease family protein [bacterium]
MTIYSYSRVNTYFTCPAQFQFRYIHKTPSPVAEGIELFLGSRFHECMEYLYGLLPQRVPTVNELLDYYRAHWNRKWQEALQKQRERGFASTLRVVREGQAVEDYYEKGQLYLENYYHKYQPFDQDRTQGIEMKVLFNLDEEGRYQMQGFIDRLGRDDTGTYWIHDYKTSSRKMTEEDAKFEDQLALYQIGLSQNPKVGPGAKVKLAWHFVAFDKDLVVSERNAKETEWLKKKYVSKIQQIEKAREFPVKPSRLCEWCEYLSLCAGGKSYLESKGKKIEDLTPALPPTPLTPEPQAPSAGLGGSFGASFSPKGRKKAKSSPSLDQLPLF